MVYKNLPPPWVSKSKLNKDDWCKFQWWLQYILKFHPKKERITVEGTNMHMVFHKYFSVLKEYRDLSDYYDIEKNIPIRTHPFRRFVYENCMKFVPPKQRGYPKYKLIINNFATFECKRWVKLNELLSNKAEIFKYYKPIVLETRWELENEKLFGTVDRIDIQIMPDKTRKILILDYKTGNVPQSIKDGIRDPMKPFSWKLAPEKMKEMHFYGFMYLLKAGWHITKELNHFLLSDEWTQTRKNGLSYLGTKNLKKEHLKTLGKKKGRIYRDGRILNKGDIHVGILYLGADKPYAVIKEFNYTSFNTLLKHLNDLRSRIRFKMFKTHPKWEFDEKVCNFYKKCSNFKICKRIMMEHKNEDVVKKEWLI